jgi:hypothetical protein
MIQKLAKMFLNGMIGKISAVRSELFDPKALAKFGQSPSVTPAPTPDRTRLTVPSRSRAIGVPSATQPVLQGMGKTEQLGDHASFKSIMMEPSALTWHLARATTFYNFAMVALAIGAILTIAATIGLIWASALKSRYIDEHLATAFAQQQQAKAETAKANERAAELLLRAQQVQLDRDKMHIELEHVRAIDGPRRLSTEQRTKIVKALVGHPMTINLLSAGNDPEAKQFADDLTAALKAAGMTVNVATSVLFIPLRGLGMTMSSSETGSVLYAALRSANLEVKDLPERNPIMIVVGSKP